MNNTPEFGKVVVFGLGLVGGSFALALKAAEQAGALLQIDREKIRQGAVACYDLRHGVASYLEVYRKLIT